MHKFVNTRLDEFFAHENHPWPPALSLHGKFRLTPSYFDAKVFDGTAIVHPCRSTTQKRSMNTVILSSFPGLKDNYKAVLGLTSSGTRTDLTREKRRKSTRRKVLPIYFAGFLQDATNKEELSNLSTEDVVKHDYPPSKHVYTTSGSHVKSNSADISISANDHQETDSRICLNVDDALNEVAATILVRTADTDVVVILVAIFHDLAQHHPGMQLCVGFGTGKHFRYYRINSICQELGEEKALALLLFTPSRVLMQHLSSAVKAISQRGKHGKHIRQPLLDSSARLMMDVFLCNLHLQHLD